MSRIIEKMQSRHTGMRGVMNGKQLPILSECESRPTYRDTRDMSEEYEMRVYISTLYRCNPAQQHFAEEQARKMLARHLYADVHHAIDEMRVILNEFEYSEDMMEVLAKLEEDISE